jgi:ribonuclease Z
VAFSGDRCVRDGFVEDVKECDLLIHEATFEDALAERAHQVGHSTISEAIQTGVQLSAKWTVLTHFSPRYGDTDLRVESENVVLAFDYLSFAFDDLAVNTARELGNRFFALIQDAHGDDGND